MNYYQIHQNKKPRNLKRKRRGFVDMFVVKAIFVVAIGASRVAILASQPIPDFKIKSGGIVTEKERNVQKFRKALSIFDTALDTATALIKIKKEEILRRFKETGRYIQ